MIWIFFIVLIDGIGFGIILPLLPVFAIKFQLTGVQLGLLTACFAFFQLITAPILGAISDKYGRKFIVIISLFFISVSYFFLAYAHTFIECLIARSLAGFFTGNISVVLAYVTDISNDKNKVKNMGIIGSASGLGFVLGPIIGGLLAGNDITKTDFHLVFSVAGIFTLFATFLAIIFLKHIPIVNKYIKMQILPQIKATTIQILSRKDILYLFIISILMWFGFSAIYIFLSNWTVIHYELSPSSFGILATIFALSAAIVMVLSHLIIQGPKALIIGFIISALSMIALMFTPNSSSNETYFICVIVCIAFGLGILYPNINSSISSFGNNSQKGFVLGISQSAGMIGQTIGPLLVGVFYSNSNPNTSWLMIAISFTLSIFITIFYIKLPKQTNSVIK